MQGVSVFLKLNVKIKFKKSKPDGVFRKVLDVSKAKKYGWKAKTSLNDGLTGLSMSDKLEPSQQFELIYISLLKNSKVQV